MSTKELADLNCFKHKQHEIRARARLGEAIDKSKHLKNMVTFWENKLSEVAHKLAETKRLYEESEMAVEDARSKIDRAMERDSAYKNAVLPN